MTTRLLALLALFFVFLQGCQTATQVSTVWKSPDPLPAEPFKKIVAFVLNASPAERRAGEDQLAAEIHSAQGIAAYTLISDADLKDRPKVESILKRENIDGAVVLRLVSSDKEAKYYPPMYSSNFNFYGYTDQTLYSPGVTLTTVSINAEISVYSVSDARLLWAGSTSTDDPSSIQDLVRQIAAATEIELKKQGLLK